MKNCYVKTRYPGIYKRNRTYRAKCKRIEGKWGWLKGDDGRIATFNKLSDARSAQSAASEQAQRIQSGLETAAESQIRAKLREPLMKTGTRLDGRGQERKAVVGGVLSEYLRYMQSMKRDKETIRRRELCLMRIFNTCNYNTLHDCVESPHLIATYLDDECLAGKSARWHNKQLEDVNVFFNWCDRRNILPFNPLKKMVRSRNEDADKRVVSRPLTKEEVWGLYVVTKSVSNTKQRGKNTAANRAMFYLIAGRSGLRWTTISKLTWSMIDLDNGIWKLPASIMKSKRDEDLPVDGQLLLELCTWRQRLGMKLDTSHERIVNSTPTYKAWVSDLKRAGIEHKNSEGIATQRCLRVSFGTQLRDAGVEIVDIADLMTHADIRVTKKRYARPKINNLRASLDRIEVDVVTVVEASL